MQILANISSTFVSQLGAPGKGSATDRVGDGRGKPTYKTLKTN